MRRDLLPVVAMLLTGIPLGTLAEPDPTTLVKERGCASCHDISNWKVGPPFKSVAVKYRTDRAAGEKRITAALKEGIGHPKSNLTAEEVRTLAQWVLNM